MIVYRTLTPPKEEVDKGLLLCTSTQFVSATTQLVCAQTH